MNWKSCFGGITRTLPRSRVRHYFPSPCERGVGVRAGLYRLRRCSNNFNAAGRAAAAYFFLSGQEKVTKKQAAPEPPLPVPCRDAQMPRSAWMRESGRFSPRQGASRTRRAQKAAPGSDTGSRLPPAEAAMLGGGYGYQRQNREVVGWAEQREAQRDLITDNRWASLRSAQPTLLNYRRNQERENSVAETPTNWDAVNAIGTVVAAAATFLAVVVALFSERIKRWLHPPNLEINLKSDSGELTTVSIEGPNKESVRPEKARYYHLCIRNSGSTAHNTALYLLSIQLEGAAGEWYEKWTGEVPLRWRHAEIYPLWRDIGASAVDVDLCALVRKKWLQLTPVILPNGFPNDTPDDPPGRWRKPVRLIVTVQLKGTDAESAAITFLIDWKGDWAEGNVEILEQLRIKQT